LKRTNEQFDDANLLQLFDVQDFFYIGSTLTEALNVKYQSICSNIPTI
jgi:hypothetical protein